MVDWKAKWDAFLDVLFMVLGHAATGFGSAFFFELTQLLTSGVTDWQILLKGALIGGSIGFFRVIVEELTKMQPQPTPVGVEAKKGKKEEVPPKKEIKKYFGF